MDISNFILNCSILQAQQILTVFLEIGVGRRKVDKCNEQVSISAQSQFSISFWNTAFFGFIDLLLFCGYKFRLSTHYDSLIKSLNSASFSVASALCIQHMLLWRRNSSYAWKQETHWGNLPRSSILMVRRQIEKREILGYRFQRLSRTLNHWWISKYQEGDDSPNVIRSPHGI